MVRQSVRRLSRFTPRRSLQIESNLGVIMTGMLETVGDGVPGAVLGVKGTTETYIDRGGRVD